MQSDGVQAIYREGAVFGVSGAAPRSEAHFRSMSRHVEFSWLRDLFRVRQSRAETRYVRSVVCWSLRQHCDLSGGTVFCFERYLGGTRRLEAAGGRIRILFRAYLVHGQGVYVHQSLRLGLPLTQPAH